MQNQALSLSSCVTWVKSPNLPVVTIAVKLITLSTDLQGLNKLTHGSPGKYQYIRPVSTEEGSCPACNNLVVLILMYYLQGIYIKQAKVFMRLNI